MTDSRLTVYWDGQCPFCAAMAQKLVRLDTSHRLLLVDYHNPAIAARALPRFTPKDLDREMHAQLPDGSWRIGYFAWAAVLKALPRTRWLGALMGLTLLADTGPKAYRWFADHRLLVSKILRLPAPCEPNSACRLPHPEGSSLKDSAVRTTRT